MNPFKINRDTLPSLDSFLTPDAVIYEQDERSLALAEIDISKVMPVCFYTTEEKAIFYSSKDITPMKADILLRRAKDDGRIMLDVQILQAFINENLLSKICEENIKKEPHQIRENSWSDVNIISIGTTYKDKDSHFMLYADQEKEWELFRFYKDMFGVTGVLPPEAYFLMYNN